MAYDVEIAPSLAHVDARAWDALVEPDNPFTEHGFLALLETSRSVGPRATGWVPCHVLLKHAGELVGALPLYLKHHSYGEFIFDFGWAQAAMGAGLSYYPKLVSAVPLTPAGGRRLLSHPAHPRAEIVRELLEAARVATRELRASSLHILFCTEEERTLAAELGFAPRLSQQYHLDHQGELHTFQDFANSLRNASRKQVRKERARAHELGLDLSMRKVAELPERDIAALWEFYNSTIDNHGSEAYLTQAFFDGLPHNPHAYATLAHDGTEAVAGALFFHKGKHLYGRYWGARREHPMLHFELCYYLPLEWGLARGVTHFEAGAQGEHKIKRGYLPRPCYSAHWAVHPGLQRAIADFVLREEPYVRAQMDMLRESTPFKRSGESED
ncbi:MAG: GNAT family N-acetyltransferase [Myxococcales bacterium]